MHLKNFYTMKIVFTHNNATVNIKKDAKPFKVRINRQLVNVVRMKTYCKQI